MSSSEDEATRQSAAWIEPGAGSAGSRIGEPRLVRGGSNIVFVEPETAAESAPPTGRTFSEDEIGERGLLRERVLEFGEIREEPIVSTRAAVREELVVRRQIEQRTERIDATLRRTEAEVERLPGRPGQPGR